nr:PEPxxWA-CTERM sorting domain-containing protein [Sphingobium boeckii]
MGLCVCPIVGTGVVATQVPAVRTAIHKATAPRAYAKPKTRVRAPGALAAPVKMAAVDPCLTNNPVIIQSGQAFNLPTLPETGPVIALNGPSTIGGTSPVRVFVPGSPSAIIPGNPGTPGTPGTDIPVSPVPEPATWAQLVFGFVIVGGVMRSVSRPRAKSEDNAPEAAV